MHRVTLRLTAFALALWSTLSRAQSTGAAPRGTLLAMGLCCHLHLNVSELPGHWCDTGMAHPLQAHPGLWAACGHRCPATAWGSCIRWVPKSFFKKTHNTTGTETRIHYSTRPDHKRVWVTAYAGEVFKGPLSKHFYPDWRELVMQSSLFWQCIRWRNFSCNIWGRSTKPDIKSGP